MKQDHPTELALQLVAVLGGCTPNTARASLDIARTLVDHREMADIENGHTASLATLFEAEAV